MKKSIVLIFMFLFSYLWGYSQGDALKPHNCGDLRLGLTADVGYSSLLYIPVSPSLSYFLTNRLSVGGGFSWANVLGEERHTADVVCKYYLTNLFLQGGFHTDFSGINSWSAGIGYTGFLGSRFYVEPALVYSNDSDVKQAGFKFGCGLLIN